MTTLEKLARANRWRMPDGGKAGERYASDETYGFNGAFLVPLEGELWYVIISDGMGWRHLSISNAQKKVIPSWHIMCRIKACFFGDDCWVVQYHPPPDEYVDDYPFCLHLWEYLAGEMPHPSIALV